jgi:arylsulfatase
MSKKYVTEPGPRRLPPPPPPLYQVVGQGALDGVLAGLAFLGWETAITGWLGMQSAVGVAPVGTLALYAVAGLIFGALAAFLRLGEGRWALQAMLLGGAFLLMGPLAAVLPPGSLLVALTALVALVFLVGFYAGRSMEHSFAGGFGIALFLAMAVLVPMDTHYLLDPFGPVGLIVNLGVLVLSGVAGALCGMLVADEVPVRVIAGVALVVGWGASLPVLNPASAEWPTGMPSTSPPVAMVVVGGLRADHLGVYGYDRQTSPGLDELASTRGLVYANAVAAAPWALPSVASLLTGRLPSHHKGGHGRPPRQHPLPDAAPVLAERLAEKGYATAAVTSHRRLQGRYGLARGFEVYDDRTGPAALPGALHSLHSLGIYPMGWAPFRDAETVTDRALSFVQSQRGSWFLLVHYADLLHAEQAPDDALVALGGSRSSSLDLYDASIAHVDGAIRRLIDGLPPEAVVLVVGDHGMELHERRLPGTELPAGVAWGHTLYEELVHVPMVVLGPGVQPSWIERPVSTIDAAPTLVLLAEGNAKGMDGVPLPELITPQEDPEDPGGA